MSFPDNVRYIEYVFGWDNDESQLRLCKFLDIDKNEVNDCFVWPEEFLYDNDCYGYHGRSGMIDVLTKEHLSMIHKYSEGGSEDSWDWWWV